MLSNNLPARLLTTFFLLSAQTSSVLAAPTRTHCQCKIVSNTASSSSSLPPPSALYSPSAAHWTPTNPSEDELASPSPSIDVCASLGSELEKFQHTEPELYDLYMRGAASSRSAAHDQHDSSFAQKPIPTSVLLSGTQPSSHDSLQARPDKMSIVCYSDPDVAWSSSPSSGTLRDFQSSPLGLWALQIIVVLSIVACVAEGVNMLRNCIQKYTSDADSDCSSPLPSPPANSLRLSGAEKRLLAIPESYSYNQDAMFSPGADKKMRAYETTRYFVSQGKSGRREFIAYDDDSDDEVNRPVL